jgi:hypothetical protein
MNTQRYTGSTIVRFLIAVSLFVNVSQPGVAFQVTTASSCEKTRDEQIAKALLIAQTELKIAMNTAQEMFALCERTRLTEIQICVDTSIARRKTAEATFITAVAACTAYAVIAPPAGAGCILVACGALASAGVGIQLALEQCGLEKAREYGKCLDTKMTDYKVAGDASLLRLNGAISQARMDYLNCVSNRIK